MRKKQRDNEVFSLSFLDAITCGFGAVILLVVLTKMYEPVIIERGKENLKGLIALLQDELFQIRGEVAVLDRRMTTVDQSLSEEDLILAQLRGDLTKISGQFNASTEEGSLQADLYGELEAARQSLTEEMRRLLKDYRPPENDTTVGGVPVDSEYIIFIIDTSPSMKSVWPTVMEKISETLQVYPRVKGFQIMNDMGKYMFGDTVGKWIKDSVKKREQAIRVLGGWEPYSNSSPVEGITEAVRSYRNFGNKVSIYVFGDDFQRGPMIENVAREVAELNRSDKTGEPVFRIHAVGFPTAMSSDYNRFANLMRVLSVRNDGTFVGLTDVRGRGFRFEINGQGI